jgi:hypothetical protein
VGRPFQPESEVDKRVARLRESKATFSRESADWWNRVPDQIKGMDFDFVIGNPAQFSSVTFIGEAEKAKKSIADPMSEAARKVRKGEDVALGEIKIAAGDTEKRDSMVQAIEEFERRTGRLLSNGAEEGGSMPHGFDGMKMGQGIGFLKDVGMLYYKLQEGFLEAEREEEMSKRPTFGVGVARIPSLSAEIHVCTICQTIITGLPA